jgi:hypothetical protein
MKAETLGKLSLPTTAHFVAMRNDKLAANYLAFVQLASIRLWLRANESEIGP